MTNEHNIDNIKQQQFNHMVKTALADIYRHLEEMIDSAGTQGLDVDNEAHQHIIDDVNAVEAEWILDSEFRKEMSILVALPSDDSEDDMDIAPSEYEP